MRTMLFSCCFRGHQLRVGKCIFLRRQTSTKMIEDSKGAGSEFRIQQARLGVDLFFPLFPKIVYCSHVCLISLDPPTAHSRYVYSTGYQLSLQQKVTASLLPHSHPHLKLGRLLEREMQTKLAAAVAAHSSSPGDPPPLPAPVLTLSRSRLP